MIRRCSCCDESPRAVAEEVKVTAAARRELPLKIKGLPYSLPISSSPSPAESIRDQAIYRDSECPNADGDRWCDQ